MHLKSLSLVNFKNYEQVDIPLSDKINCFVGANGVGKTNILDAVHYLSLCKSNLNPVDTQNIRYEQDFSVVQGIFERKGREENIYCGIRKFTINLTSGRFNIIHPISTTTMNEKKIKKKQPFIITEFMPKMQRIPEVILWRTIQLNYKGENNEI